MSDLEINASWVRQIAQRAGSNGSKDMMVAVSVNRFDKLEEWAHQHSAFTPYAERGVWHNLMFYGVPFMSDSTLQDDEVMIKEKP